MDEYISSYRNVEEFEGYAKLEGPTMKHFITKLIVYLGRESNSIICEAGEDQQICCIGQEQKISRRHAKICWNPKKLQWEISVISKNKVIVNGESLRNKDPPIKLDPCSTIKIDNVHFYFFPAVIEEDSQLKPIMKLF
jgi:hypothetical protein